MPEIYEMFFNLSELFRFFSKSENDITHQIDEYEAKLESNMAENRLQLFGYESEFEHV